MIIKRLKLNNIYTLTEAADVLDVSTRTLRRRIKEGSLKAAKLGKGYQIRGRSLVDFFLGRESEDGKTTHISLKDDVVYDASGAAKVLGVNPRTIHKLTDEGKIKAARIGRERRILGSNIRKFLNG